MSKRDKLIANMKTQLDDWSAELHALETKVENAEAQVRDKYRHAIEELREKRVVAEAKLDQIRHAGEETWEDLEDDAQRAWAAFKAGVDAFRDFYDRS